jgi:hypothetical protein
MRGFFVVLATTVVATALAGCGGDSGKTLLRGAEDVAPYVDDLLRDTSKASRWKAAANATPVAQAAYEDAPRLTALEKIVDETPDGVCKAAGIISKIGEVSPTSTDPVTLTPFEQVNVEADANKQGVDPDVTGRVIHVALGTAQSTWAKAADTACNVADNV